MLSGLKNLAMAHQLPAIAIGFTALVAVVTAATTAFKYFAEADERAAKATKELAGELTTNRDSLKQLANDIGKLEGKADPTTEEVDALKNAIIQLSNAAPDLAAKFG